MFYIHYDEEGNITSVSNIKATLENYIKINKKTFDEFNNGAKAMFDYKVIENVKTKGSYHIVPINIEEEPVYHTNFVNKADTLESGIQIVQEKNGWIVNNLIDDVNCTALSIGEDYLKEYYIVDSTNRFILLDKFSINLKELATQKEIKISNCSSHKTVSVLTNSSHIPHVHTIGYKHESN